MGVWEGGGDGFGLAQALILVAAPPPSASASRSCLCLPQSEKVCEVGNRAPGEREMLLRLQAGCALRGSCWPPQWPCGAYLLASEPAQRAGNPASSVEAGA